MKRQHNRGLRVAYMWLQAFGVDPRVLGRAIRGIPQAMREYTNLRRQNGRLAAPWALTFSSPNLHDRFAESGATRGHYFIQDLLVAQKIMAANPVRHVDIGSRIDGFVAHVASFRPIEVLDIRPLDLQFENISFRQCDITLGSNGLEEYADSVSCLHALEHIGLGRYGDRPDINGHLRAFDTITTILKKQGTLYLSVPIGEERIEFNGHRVFALATILGMTQDAFDLVEFSYIDDSGMLHEAADALGAEARRTFDLRYGCGIFQLRKR
jgi:hypothetical protein